MGDVLSSVFLSSLIIVLSLSVGITSLNEADYNKSNLDSYSQPQHVSSDIEIFNISNSDCESVDSSPEIMYYTCKSTHPNAGSFYAVFDGEQMNYFSNSNFGKRSLEKNSIILDKDGNSHLAYISKDWVTYGSDPLGAGFEVHNVNYAYFNGTSWENQVVISDWTEDRSWWDESFGSLQLAVETDGKVHLTYVHRIDGGSINDYFRHWTLENENSSNITITSTPWNGNELSPTFLNINSENRLYLTYYNNHGLSLMVKNPNSNEWFGSEIDISSEIAQPSWSDDRLTFAPHFSTLGLNEQLHVCYYDTESESLMYISNSTSLAQFALNEVPIQWSITTISSNNSIKKGMSCSLEVGLNGDVHLFYARSHDNNSTLSHAVLHNGSWYLSELYNPQEDCNQSEINCYSGSLPIFSESEIYLRLGDKMLQIGLDDDYENQTDYDNDGVINVDDVYPFDDSEHSDYDGDGLGDNADIDDDNDGVEDLNDLFPFDELEQYDSDGDGIGDYADLDDDNDGYSDDSDMFPMDSTENNDTDGDGIGDNADTDDDNDGWSDTIESECMSDPLDKSDNPPDLNSNSVCDKSENYTHVTESKTDLSDNSTLIVTVGIALLVISIIGVLVLRKFKKNDDDDWLEEEEDWVEEDNDKFYPVAAPHANPRHVDSWEGLPDGEWLDNDEEGIHWYLANDGTHWYSTDDGYRVWDES
jgi:hypothetical protein